MSSADLAEINGAHSSLAANDAGFVRCLCALRRLWQSGDLKQLTGGAGIDLQALYDQYVFGIMQAYNAVVHLGSES